MFKEKADSISLPAFQSKFYGIMLLRCASGSRASNHAAARRLQGVCRALFITSMPQPGLSLPKQIRP